MSCRMPRENQRVLFNNPQLLRSNFKKSRTVPCIGSSLEVRPAGRSDVLIEVGYIGNGVVIDEL